MPRSVNSGPPVQTQSSLEAIVATICRADAEIATKSHVEAVVNKAIVQIILAQLLIAGVVVAFLKLTA